MSGKGIEQEDDRTLLARLGGPAASSLALPRALMVFAHPDDEVLAVGARLERFRASRLVTITDGAPRSGEDARQHGFTSLEEYAGARERELVAALEMARLPSDVIAAFPERVADQEACFELVSLARAIAGQIRAFLPEVVLTHPYEGGHPDHDACAFAVHAAVRLIEADEPEGTIPLIAEAPFYQAGKSGAMRTGEFLEGRGVPLPLVFALDAEEQRRKRERLACFRTQAETLAQFTTEREMFRVAPRYDFAVAPHAGELFYERFAWGMRGERFRQLAGEALEALFAAEMKGRLHQRA